MFSWNNFLFKLKTNNVRNRKLKKLQLLFYPNNGGLLNIYRTKEQIGLRWKWRELIHVLFTSKELTYLIFLAVTFSVKTFPSLCHVIPKMLLFSAGLSLSFGKLLLEFAGTVALVTLSALSILSVWLTAAVVELSGVVSCVALAGWVEVEVGILVVVGGLMKAGAEFEVVTESVPVYALETLHDSSIALPAL